MSPSTTHATPSTPRMPARSVCCDSSDTPLMRFTPSTPALSPDADDCLSTASSSTGLILQTPESPLAGRQTAHLPRRKPIPWTQPSSSAAMASPVAMADADSQDPFLASPTQQPPSYAPAPLSASETSRPPAYTRSSSDLNSDIEPSSAFAPAVDLGVSAPVPLGGAADEQLPGYASECETEPKTLARGLWLWGFVCPLLWLIGIWIMYIPLRPIEEETDVEKAQKLEEMIVILRATELKYARRCAWSFTVFAVILCCAIAIGVTVVHTRR